jgi:ubiquinone/menaquinone biosynthesis C-methylase UbiE
VGATNDAFYDYYAAESLSEHALQRFVATKEAVTRAAQKFGISTPPWNIADIGCGAGTQAMLWAREGHHVFGIDINEPLVELGRERTKQAGLSIDLVTGTATALPWPDESIDICLSPELLEHVKDWQTCVAEASRVLRPGGVLYMSTTNKLCPVQHEFDLPAYSWYPAALKRHYERVAVTSRPELVNHAKYPAVNWFSYYSLRRYMQQCGFECLDRFDVAALGPQSTINAMVLAALRSTPITRWLAHACTPYTAVFAKKTKK